jgi:hypothetical protein
LQQPAWQCVTLYTVSDISLLFQGPVKPTEYEDELVYLTETFFDLNEIYVSDM